MVLLAAVGTAPLPLAAIGVIPLLAAAAGADVGFDVDVVMVVAVLVLGGTGCLSDEAVGAVLGRAEGRDVAAGRPSVGAGDCLGPRPWPGPRFADMRRVSHSFQPSVYFFCSFYN